MVKHATFATRFVSFMDEPAAPARLSLGADQEVVGEDPPSQLSSGGLQRFVYVRGPLQQPVHVIRSERLPDGTTIEVRYEPELDEVCAATAHG